MAKVYVSFLLDETGSMEGCRDTTISGFNEYVKSLREDEDNKYRFTLVKFDSTHTTVVHDGVKIAEVPDLTRDTYRPGQMTPLYDAIAGIIKATESKCGKRGVAVVIMTDGLENASKEWNQKTIFDLIEEKKKGDWTFVFLGANQDSYATGVAMGIPTGNIANYTPGNEVEAFSRMILGTKSWASTGGVQSTDFMDKVDDGTAL